VEAVPVPAPVPGVPAPAPEADGKDDSASLERVDVILEK
jgi:hypothetical protein